MSRKIYAYIRVSTSMQDEKGTQDTQMHELKKYADEKGLIIDKVFSDVGSGKTMDREQMNNMLEALNDGDIVLVAEQDRLSRNTIDFLSLMSFFKEKGVSVYTPRGELKYSTPEEQFQVDIMAAVSKLERMLINRRTKAGIQKKIQETGTWGRKPAITPRKEKKFNTYFFEKGIRNKSELARLLQVSRTTLYKFMKEKGYLDE